MLRRAALAFALAVTATGASANPELLRMQRDPNQWVMPNGNYASWRYSELNQITRENVGNLKPSGNSPPACCAATRRAAGGGGGDVHPHPLPQPRLRARPQQAGRVLWRYEPTQDPTVIGVMCCDTVNRGPAYADGKIILSQADTTRRRARRQDRREVWKVKNGDPAKGETATMAPMVFGDKVLIGISGGEYGIRGHVTAYNLADGKQAWRAYPSARTRRSSSIRRRPRRWASRSAGKLAEDLGRRPVEDGRRLHLGLVQLRSRPEPDLLRQRQSRAPGTRCSGPATTSGR